jgi:hypothetical protein
MTRFPLQHLGDCDMRDDPTPCERIVVYAGLLISFVASWAAIVWLAMMLAGCKQIDWPAVPWTNVVINATTTTTLPPTPTPTIPPAPAKDLRGNYDPLSCNPINPRPAMIFHYWETRDNGGGNFKEVPKAADWLVDGVRVVAIQEGGWFILNRPLELVTGAIILEITGRDGVFRYSITEPQKKVMGLGVGI